MVEAPEKDPGRKWHPFPSFRSTASRCLALPQSRLLQPPPPAAKGEVSEEVTPGSLERWMSWPAAVLSPA